MYEVPGDVLNELRELRKIGDTLQSAADRLADYVERGDKPPYEVAMACHEARVNVLRWTDARKSSR